MFLIFLQFFLGFLWVRVSIIVLVVSSFAPWFEPPDFKFSKNCPDPNELFHYALPLIATSKSRISNCIIAGCIHLISLWLSLFTLSVFVCFSGFFGFLWVLRVWALLGSRSDTLYLQTIYFASWCSRHPGDRHPIFLVILSYGMLTSRLWLFKISRRRTIVFINAHALSPLFDNVLDWIQTLAAFWFLVYTHFSVIFTVNGCFPSRTPAHFPLGSDLTCFVTNTLLPLPLQPLLVPYPLHLLRWA